MSDRQDAIRRSGCTPHGCARRWCARRARPRRTSAQPQGQLRAGDRAGQIFLTRGERCCWWSARRKQQNYNSIFVICAFHRTTGGWDQAATHQPCGDVRGATARLATVVAFSEVGGGRVAAGEAEARGRGGRHRVASRSICFGHKAVLLARARAHPEKS